MDNGKIGCCSQLCNEDCFNFTKCPLVEVEIKILSGTQGEPKGNLRGIFKRLKTVGAYLLGKTI